MRPLDRLCQKIENATTDTQKRIETGNFAKKLGLFGGATRYEKLAGIRAGDFSASSPRYSAQQRWSHEAFLDFEIGDKIVGVSDTWRQKSFFR